MWPLSLESGDLGAFQIGLDVPVQGVILVGRGATFFEYWIKHLFSWVLKYNHKI